MSPNLKRISQLLATAQSLGYVIPTTVTYRKVRDLASEARFPAQQLNCIWHFDPEDVDAIAAAIGLQREHSGQKAAA
jgi:hypothetical protein